MIKLRALALDLAVLITGCFSVQADAQQKAGSPPSGTVTGKMYKFDKIAEGIYYATAANATRNGPSAGGNHPIIVNDRDVMVVDAGLTPAAAQALLTDLNWEECVCQSMATRGFEPPSRGPTREVRATLA
ncbi:MAG: hypothetical protein ABSD45_12880 [Terriglobia bacterium]|jgi:hypothetical protein